MTGELIQDGIATLIATGAVAALVRRVVGFIRPAATAAPGCSSCPSSRCPGDAARTAGVSFVKLDVVAKRAGDATR